MDTHLEEAGHGLVGAADLDLVEGGLIAIAAGSGALHGGLVGVVPGARTTEDVLALLALEGAAREERRLDGALVWTGPALETVAPRVGGRRYRQDVAAVRTD